VWIRVDDDVIDHRKIDHLAELLGCDRTTAVGLMVGVWGYAKRYHPTGDLTDVRLAHLHRKLGWTTAGVGGTLSHSGPVGVPLLSLGPIREDVRAVLLDAGWMDRLEDGRLVLHDWDERNGPEAERRRKARDRKAFWRAQQAATAAGTTSPSGPSSVPQRVPRKRGQKRDCPTDVTKRVRSTPYPHDAHASTTPTGVGLAVPSRVEALRDQVANG
jgi:hypothetical protein